ncbi:MAG: hypothetical protein D6704_04735 [Nitrospirae bacterium]|nr:MAG: hypothetical protein D6704_04735 [Nitrospirota bacterium]
MGIVLGLSHVSLADDLDDRIKRLEERLTQLQAELNREPRIYLTEMRERPVRSERHNPSSSGTEETGNMVFFRGGGAWAASDRSNEVFTDVFGTGGTFNGGDSGYYVGAGLDLVLSKNLWGMLSKTWAVGEIGVEFKRFNSKNVTVAVPATCATAGVATCTASTGEVQITMLTVDIAPKIKFLEGSRFRPWVIPIGLDFHVISPPSNDTTVLDIGAQFGLGGEYRLWKAFHLGLDGRFHLATGQTDTTNNFGTVGGYVGIAF